MLVDADGVPRASRCAEIIVNERHEFYDFEAKYLDDSATLVVPAELPAGVEDRVRDLAVRAFDALDCDGLARVDFFVRDRGTIVVNEVNTMPGFTSISMYPRMWAATGVDYPELVDRLIADALRKGTGPALSRSAPARRQRLTTGQVSVRVMPGTAWMRATTSLPSSSIVRASARTMTS